MAEITIKIVRVENPFDKPSLIVRDTDTVARLKRNIRSWKNIPVEEQLLVHYQEILDDNKTLQYYGIGDESKVQLLIQRPGAMPISYRIKNKQGFLRVRKKDLITNIKGKISSKEAVGVDSFYITLLVGQTEKRLDDNATVASSGITANAEISCNVG